MINNQPYREPIPWLLERENPSVCFWTLIDLLERPADDADVRATRAAIAGYRPVPGLLDGQRDDGMWHCRHPDRYGYLRPTIDILRVAALDPELAAQPVIARGAAVVCELLMEPGVGRCHVKNPWTVLEHPYFDYSVVSALDALARPGYPTEHPKIAAAMDYLLSRQLADGTWPLDQVPYHLPFGVGQPGEPNRSLSLNALRVIKLLCREA